MVTGLSRNERDMKSMKKEGHIIVYVSIQSTLYLLSKYIIAMSRVQIAVLVTQRTFSVDS